MDPEVWRSTLESYAGTVKLAVALTDAEGRVLGDCYNPRPIWQMARSASPWGSECAFCLVPSKPCTAVRDAIRTGQPAFTLDRAGLAHIAVPLALGGQTLGAVIAGQVFRHYPEPTSLRIVAREMGVPPQRFWNQAVREPPVGEATLQIYAKLLVTLGEAFVGARYSDLLHARLLEAYENIRRSLQEKEVMLREIQHRVKNNLQIVASLLHMQSGGLDSTNDAKALAIMEASQQRVQTMARIHDFLYGAAQVGTVDLGDYVTDLAGMVISAFQASGSGIQARFTLAPALLSLRQAIPCGLIVNELVTNVFKYAYPNATTGEIMITVDPMVDNKISLTISDHGIGMPDGLDWQHSQSVGMQILRVLTRQLDGTLVLDTRNGVSFNLQFQRDASVH
ncbi:MAG: histidine kinase dimerization/phosphoacceptor domain -containing protein [Acidobacteriota bacterium]